MSEANGIKGKALRVAKSALCVMLCCVMVFAYSFKKPTEAHATAVVVAGVVVGTVAVAAALTALGVYVNGTVSDETYAQSCQRVWDNLDEGIRRKVTCAAVAGGCVYNLTSEFLTSVGNQVVTAYNTVQNFANMTAIDRLPHGTQLVSGGVNANTMAEFFGTEQAYIKDNMTTLSTPFTVVDAVSINQYVGEENALVLGSDSGGYQYRIYTDSGKLRVKTYRLSNETKVSDFNPSANLLYVCTLFCGSGLYYVLAYRQSQEMTYILAYPLVGTGAAVGTAPGKDVLGIDIEKWIADGFSILNNKVSDVVDKLGDVAGKLDDTGSLQIPIPVPQNKIDSDLRTKTQDKVLPTSISDEQSKEKNDKTNKDKNTSPPKLPGLPDIALPNMLTKKFPFCIPFDIYVIISGFYCSEAKAPHWEIPVENKRLGWHWKIVLDWSQFEPVAVVCRWFTGAAWVFALILVTRKLIGAGGGD